MFKFTKEHAAQIAALIKQIGGDGHTIYNPVILDEVGLPEAKERFTRKYERDPSAGHKETIYGHDGSPIQETTYVYGLTLLEGIVYDLGLKQSDKTGRGFRAQDATVEINKWLMACAVSA